MAFSLEFNPEDDRDESVLFGVGVYFAVLKIEGFFFFFFSGTTRRFVTRSMVNPRQ